MSGGSTGSRIDPIYRTEKIHLADVDSIVAEDGVRYRHVEVGVRNCHLQEVVLPAEELAGRPRKTNFAVACARILRLSHTLGESDSLSDADAHISDRPLVVFVLGWRLSRKPSRCSFDVVASALDLVDERLHV